MRIRFGIIALSLIVVLALGCSTTEKAEQFQPIPPPTAAPLSVKLYAQWCADTTVEIFDLVPADTWGEAVRNINVTLRKFGAVTPPRELDSFHNLQVEALVSMKDVAAARNARDTINHSAFLESPNVISAGRAISAEENRLPGDIVAVLDEEGCI